MNGKRISAIMPLIADNAAPALLSSLVVSSAAYIYSGSSAAAIALFTLVSVVYSAVLFFMYEKLRITCKNWLTTIVIVLVGAAVSALAMSVADMNSTNDIALWFMEPSRFNYIYYGNIFAMILVLGFVLISCLYYFTRVLYRGVFVFLICLCPFCLFAKTFTSIPVIYPILIMTLFFFIMINGRAEKGKNMTGMVYLPASVVAFVLAVTVIASFFPKLENAPYRELFDEFITGVSIGTPGNADFNGFTSSSSNSTSPDDDTIAFRLYGDNPYYIKRQCFNIFSSDDTSWHYYGNSNDGYSNWRRFTKFEDPTVLYEAANKTDDIIVEKKCLIQAADGGIRAIYTPENIIDLEPYNSEKKIYRTELDEYFLERKNGSEVTSYETSWAEFIPDIEFADKFTDKYVNTLLEGDDEDASIAAASYILAKEQAFQYNKYLLSDAVMNDCYSSANARKEIKRLAEEIAGSYPNDYYKAKSIVNYFKSGSYIYDSSYTAPNGFPDTFILETKRGACASYATAMVLMCRELGMTARYCEGFLVKEYDEQGKYWFVTSADAHAFVQVWIDGYGWTVFDPTSNTKDNGFFDMTFFYVGALAAVAVAAGTLFVILRPKVAEARFVRKIKHASGAEQYTLVYRRINRIINDMLGHRENTMTPTDTALKCKELLECDISSFIENHAFAVYGGQEVTEDCSDVYTRFAKAYRDKRREERKRKWKYSAAKK